MVYARCLAAAAACASIVRSPPHKLQGGIEEQKNLVPFREENQAVSSRGSLRSSRALINLSARCATCALMGAPRAICSREDTSTICGTCCTSSRTSWSRRSTTDGVQRRRSTPVLAPVKHTGIAQAIGFLPFLRDAGRAECPIASRCRTGSAGSIASLGSKAASLRRIP